jgi:hypothetical protein
MELAAVQNPVSMNRSYSQGYRKAWLHILYASVTICFFAFYFYVGGSR